MKKLMLIATLLVAGTSVSFADGTMNDYNNTYKNNHRYGSQMSTDYSNNTHGNHRRSEYNKNHRTSYRSGSCCDGNGSHRSSSRRSGHRNNYNY